VLGHFLQRTRCDKHVDGVDGRGVHPHEHLVVGDVRPGDVVTQDGLSAEAVEGEGSH